MTSTDIIWNEHRTRLLTFVRRRVATLDDAEDLVQDILLKAARHTDQLESEASLQAWLYRIARNAIADHYRSRRLETESLAVDLAEEDPEADAIQAMAECIEPFIQDLQPEFRDALVMADLHRLPQAEVARRLGISLSGAKSRIQRARVQLADAFTDCCNLIHDASGRIMDREPRKECGCRGVCQHKG
ncbi:MAG: RNA polymerase sigma factor SigZ [Bacteroidetes bacterium]|nr:RNA polymerase sigma factor SigZ [Bacteroidota bacterium]MDA0874521.1 RNA polymerase sigma factor SigZ [Bacteroidota bacterium]